MTALAWPACDWASAAVLACHREFVPFWLCTARAKPAVLACCEPFDGAENAGLAITPMLAAATATMAKTTTKSDRDLRMGPLPLRFRARCGSTKSEQHRDGRLEAPH